ncbi:MAG: sigma-70 family RNA polymerase sigma factor [Planctomycetes bacterium]|nr:sigma-70 family RNA polymerase sigma factor [Planctomycetota bacterium]
MAAPTDSPVDAARLLAHAAWVRRLARTLVADAARRDDADELEQQAWSEALERPPRHADGLRGWWRTVVENVARRRRRAASTRERHERAAGSAPHSPAAPLALATGAAPAAADSVARAELHRRVVDAVLALPEPYRSTLLLRFFDDLPPRAIARRLALPVETIRTRMKRGLERLREGLAAQGSDRESHDWLIGLLILAKRESPMVLVWKGAIPLLLVLSASGSLWWSATAEPHAPLTTTPLVVPRIPAEAPPAVAAPPAEPTAIRTAIAAPAREESAPAPSAATLTIRGNVLGPDGGPARLAEWLLPALTEEERAAPGPAGIAVVAYALGPSRDAWFATRRFSRGVGSLDLARDAFEITVDADCRAIAIVARNTVLGSIERIDAPALLRTGGRVEGGERIADFRPDSSIVVERWRLPSTNARGAIRFRVLDEDGRELAVSPATVTLVDEWAREELSAVADPDLVQRTANGFTGLPFGHYRVIARPSGHVAGSQSVQLTAAAPEAELELRLRPAAARIRGSIRFVDATADSPVVVSVCERTDSGWTTLEASASLRHGRSTFEIVDLPAGELLLVDHSVGLVPALASIDRSDPAADVELSFRRGTLVRFLGRCEESACHALVENASRSALQRVRIVDEFGRVLTDGALGGGSIGMGGAPFFALAAGRYSATLFVAEHDSAIVEFEVPEESAADESEEQGPGPHLQRVEFPLRRRPR